MFFNPQKYIYSESLFNIYTLRYNRNATEISLGQNKR